MPSSNSGESAWRGLASLILPITIVGAVLVFVVPVPPAVLDLLLAANLTLAVLILLTTLGIRSPREFSAFPTLLLTTTLTRLVLNVATTRRILTHGGDMGIDAAGTVVRAFGEFVAGDQVLVGVILFAILVVIQFVVITKGATRISEVAARFMLDGLPGRQMAIDADLHAGIIDQHQAHARREDVYRQADFFGAMDGAGKFVRGDAVAGVVILMVNIAGGLFIGVAQQGMPFDQAVEVYTKLTIGDGLVSQIPAFLISLAAGLIVTRSSTSTDIGRDVVSQLTRNPSVMGVSSGFLAILALTPLPKAPLLILSAALGYRAYRLRGTMPADEEEAEARPAPRRSPTHARPHAEAPRAEAEAPRAAEPARPAGDPPSDDMTDLLHVDLLELEIGYRLISLADSTRGGNMLERLRTVRQSVARELGLIVPQVRIHDEIGLTAHEYRVKIRGTVVGTGSAYAGRLLAIPPAGAGERPEGREVVDPATGRDAVWIHAEGREVAELAGCKIMEASAVVAAHFGQIVRNHADELLTRDQIERLLDRVRATAPTLANEVVPGLLRPGELQRLLQNLLREQVSVRDLETILETMAVHAGKTKDVAALTELARQSLARQITESHRSDDGRLRVVTLSRELNSRLAAVAAESDAHPSEALGDETVRGILRAVALGVAALVDAGLPPIVLTTASARAVLKDLTRADLPRLIVLSQREIPRDTPVEVLGTIVEEADEADDSDDAPAVDPVRFATTEAFA
ncbi:flagellar biosynthesis protein FlhA [Paludisphaera sp.]|uniref:flagellar biosynthesis protein FlhA n=1 Tax=Paludisphaera sp. TaxID=2017432 RepID=UPI00301DD505